MKTFWANETSLCVSVSGQTQLEENELIQWIISHYPSDIAPSLNDVIPAYSSALFIFKDTAVLNQQALKRTSQKLTHWIESTAQHHSTAQVSFGHVDKIIEIPVYYSSDFGLDLPHIAHEKGISISEVITAHQRGSYRVYALGFAPGFAYLGGTPNEISVQRQLTPRANVTKGSVAIANNQAAVYPSDTPGGWNLVGRTPLFDHLQSTEELINIYPIGGSVKFTSITLEEYNQQSAPEYQI
ncbi:MAG: 5-oxoprolinase subunit B family protein [Pontibacterium sp.]